MVVSTGMARDAGISYDKLDNCWPGCTDSVAAAVATVTISYRGGPM
jgi:hypothetical protein